MNEHLSLELSKRLQELGVVVEVGHVWEVRALGTLEEKKKVVLSMFKDYNLGREYFPAPTFIELWAVMPWVINYGTTTYVKTLSEDSRGVTTASYEYTDWEESEFVPVKESPHESPVEAAGLLLIWLAENGHVEVSP